MWSKTVSFETIKNYRFEKVQHTDCAVAVHPCFCEELCSGKVNPALTYCKDEAQFYLNGHINTKTVDNSILIYELPLHDIKVRVCCTITAKIIVGPPPIFLDIVKLVIYIGEIFAQLFKNSRDEREHSSFSKMMQLCTQPIIHWLPFVTFWGLSN